MLKMFRLIVFTFCLVICVHGSKRSRMNAQGNDFFLLKKRKVKSSYFFYLEVNDCLEKSKNLTTSCEFIKCFHERYHCNDESVTAWAYELCQQFPMEIILQFTAVVRQKNLLKLIFFNKNLLTNREDKQ